jgi:hypothetical protein
VRVLRRTVLFACVLLALLAAGCSGDGGSGADDSTLPDSAFKEVVVGALRQAGFEAEPELDLKVERWGTTVEELHDLATDNLLRQTNEEEQALCEPSGAGQDLCGWASSDGYDATRMIVPGLRRQIVREYGGPAVYAVPMDNVFVALPLEVLDSDVNEKRLRARVEHDFQTSETPVSPELFVERDGELAVLK